MLSGWLLAAAIVTPPANLAFALWGHWRAYRLGYLSLGAMLGAALGPFGVLAAGLLAPRPRRSLAIMAQLYWREKSAPGLWQAGLALMLLGSGAALWTLGGPLLGLPAGPWGAMLGSVAVLLLGGGALLLAMNKPPPQLCPPLGDHAEYREDDPELAAHLEEHHKAYLDWRTASWKRYTAMGLTLAGALLILTGLALLAARDYNPQRASVYGDWSFAALLAGGTLFLLGLGAILLVSREDTRLIQSRLSQRRMNEEWMPRLPADLRQRFLEAAQEAGRCGGLYLRQRRAVASSSALLLGLGLKGLLGLYGGVGPLSGPASAWFLLALALGWLPWLLARLAERNWEQHEQAAWDCVALSKEINALLKPGESVYTPPPNLPLPQAALAGIFLNFFGRVCFFFVLLGNGLQDADWSPLWLLLAMAGYLSGIALYRRAIGGYAESLREMQAAHAEEAEAERAKAAQAAGVDPSRTGEPSLEEKESYERLYQMGYRSAVLLHGLRKNALWAAMLGFGGLALFLFYFNGLLESAALTTASVATPMLVVLLVLGCTAVGLLGFRSAAENELAALPDIYITDNPPHLDFERTRRYLERREREAALLRRIAFAAGWLLCYLSGLWWLNEELADAAARTAALPILRLLGGAALLALAYAALRLIPLAREIRRSRRYARRVAEEHFRAKLREWLAKEAQEQGETTEDHGHFSVSHAGQPDSAWIEERVQHIVSGELGEVPGASALDFWRSICHSLGWTAVALWFAVVGKDNLQPFLSTLSIAMMVLGFGGGLACGAALKQRRERVEVLG